VVRSAGAYTGAAPTHAPGGRILHDLCEQMTPVIEPEDIPVGRMPEVLPAAEEEQWIAQHPELFTEPGVPGWLHRLNALLLPSPFKGLGKRRGLSLWMAVWARARELGACRARIGPIPLRVEFARDGPNRGTAGLPRVRAGGLSSGAYLA
jgi:hypothetical protein